MSKEQLSTSDKEVPKHKNALEEKYKEQQVESVDCLLYTSPSPRDRQKSRMPSSA